MPVITIDLAVVMTICGFIIALGGAFVWIKKALAPVVKPVLDLQEEVKDLRAKTVRDYERLNEHERLMKSISNDDKEVLKAVLLLLSHAETGNNTGEISAGRKELEQYLLTR